MRRIILYCVDLLLVDAATGLAFLLRENFELSTEKVLAFAPYLLMTTVAAAVVIPALGLSRSVWRFSTMTDYLHLLAASFAIVLGAVVLGFSANRLEGVARSVPVLQILTIAALLVGARAYMRVRHAGRRRPAQQFAVSTSSDGLQRPSVLIVGINRLTELLLQSAQELSPDHLRVAGLIGQDLRHTGRLMHRHPVLGAPEQLPEIIKNLQVHGIVIDRIFVTTKRDSLSPEGQAALAEIAEGRDVRVEYLPTSLGLETPDVTAAAEGTEPGPALRFNDGSPDDLLAIGDGEREALRNRSYWRLKRAIDAVGALVLLVLFAPVMAVVAVLVHIDVGHPVVFWQQRPGLGGIPFKLYKFRTMRSAHDADGRLVADDARLSAIGRFLRRSRLDELPQLFHILVGQMSFIGPRPLLPVDQPVGSAARLLVRPGLTGWAQVTGGRNLSAVDKVALDVWYVRNARLSVDLAIILRTVVMVVFGERENAAAVRAAWEDVRGAHSGSGNASLLAVAKRPVDGKLAA